MNRKRMDKEMEKSKNMNLKKLTTKNFAFILLFLKLRILFLVLNFNIISVFRDVCVYNGAASVQFSHSVVSDSFRPHESQHVRPRCPSPTPGVHPDSCPSSQWCHPAISYSVVPFSSCPESLPASASFLMSQLFAWGGREEPPHVRGQGQKPGGPHARRVVAKRSYPTSEVRGSGQRPRVPDCDRAGTAERSYPASEIRAGGWEEIPRVRGQGQRAGEATPLP